MSSDERSPLDEMFALGDAETIDEFHRRLVLFPPLNRNRADAFEPVSLFRHHHQSERRAAATSALLLVTDRRWRSATGRVMNAIAATDLIDEEDLDLLARSFLAADRCVYWRAPEEWFEDEIEIILEDLSDSESAGPDTASTPTDGSPTMIAREIRPPLRRWAAAHLVRRDPSIWASVLQAGSGLDTRSGAAVMLGLLDAIDSLPEPAQSVLRRRAVDWPHRDVRAAAQSGQAPAGQASVQHQRPTPTADHTKPQDAPRSSPSAQERLF
jgi:hypothetical protein